MIESLIYKDEEDKSYGLTGMAITMAVFNNEEKIWEINLDRSSNAIDFVHEFYFSGNPRCSAKMVWNEMTRNFHLSLAMALGNVLSRRFVSQNATRLSKDEESELHAIALAEGLDECGLEADEVDQIWDKDYVYLKNVFLHPSVRSATKEIADLIRQRRSLSRHDLLELLSKLS